MGIYREYMGVCKFIQIQGLLAKATGQGNIVLGLHPSSRPRTLAYFDHSAREMGHKLQHVDFSH